MVRYRRTRSRCLSEVYGVLAVGALKEHAHAARMAATSREYGNRRSAEEWEERALQEESAAVGNSQMAAHYALKEMEDSQ